jgi:hypothetical protein
MSIVSKLGVGLGLAALAAASVGPASAASCGRYGGWGIGVTQDIAKFMSNKATHQAMDKDNAKPTTALKTECNTNAIIYVQCHTTTKACAK